MSLPHLTEEELDEFRRKLEGLHDMSLGTSMRVGWERRLLATIDAARGQRDEAERLLKEIVEQLATSTANTCMNCEAPAQECTCEDFGPARAYLKERGLT